MPLPTPRFMLPMGISTPLLFFLLFFPLLSLCCPIEWFNCENHNSSETRNCGSHNIRCVNSTLEFQFQQNGDWYPAENITYPEKTLLIRDEQLAKKLQPVGCDFRYEFSSPIHSFLVPNITDSLAFFDCRPDSYVFSKDIFQKYGCSYCKGYDLYYRSWPGMPAISHEGDVCGGVLEEAMVGWELTFEEDSQKIVGFSLRSLSFSHQHRPNASCFDCAMRGGACSSAKGSGTSSSCSCNLPCRDNSSKRALAIGLGVGGGFVALVMLIIGFVCYKRHNKDAQSTPTTLGFLGRGFSSELSSFGNDPESLSGDYYKMPIFTYKELHEATGGFDSNNELGDGGFGVVFKGKLKDGRIVAVKRLYERNHRRVRQFRNEVEILNRLRHRNLVALYGCTSPHDSEDLVLVYEYIPNGTVADHLHGSRAMEHALTWPIRLSIAVESADALAYLHAHTPQIIHRDVKTSNILLDHSFTVKVADFGLSRLFPLDVTHVSTAPQGTPGYVDPEYHQCYQLTDKSDVYSFGVVLVELISSMPAVDITRNRSEINLSNMAIDRIPRGLVGELVDPTLGYANDPDVRRMVEQVSEVAYRCLQPERDMRPTMEEVRETLKDIAGTTDSRNGVKEKEMRDDARLLTTSASSPFSPNSVADRWVSVSTTPHTSA